MGDGVIMDISNPEAPKVVETVRDTTNFAFWHSATFNSDGTKVVFTDELGGGGQATCNDKVGPTRGANGIYDLSADNQLTFRSYYKIPRNQADTENCVAHNGSIVPVNGRDVMVQSWYQGGVSLWEFTDSGAPRELGYFERGPLAPANVGGTWSAYYYNGFVYSSDIQKGFDVLMLKDPTLRKANSVRLERAEPAEPAGLPDPLTPRTRACPAAACVDRPAPRTPGAGRFVRQGRVTRTGSPGRTRPGTTTRALSPRSRIGRPTAPLTKRIASAPNRSTNFAHPVCGGSVTSMTAPRTVGSPMVSRLPAGRLSCERSRSRKSWSPGQRPARRVAGEEGDHPGAHHVELHLGVRAAVGGPAAAALHPGVADQADGQVELALVEHLALARRGAAHDELEGAHVTRGGEQLAAGRPAAPRASGASGSRRQRWSCRPV